MYKIEWKGKRKRKKQCCRESNYKGLSIQAQAPMSSVKTKFFLQISSPSKDGGNLILENISISLLLNIPATQDVHVNIPWQSLTCKNAFMQNKYASELIRDKIMPTPSSKRIVSEKMQQHFFKARIALNIVVAWEVKRFLMQQMLGVYSAMEQQPKKYLCFNWFSHLVTETGGQPGSLGQAYMQLFPLGE